MDYIVLGDAKSWTQLSDFHFFVLNTYDIQSISCHNKHCNIYVCIHICVHIYVKKKSEEKRIICSWSQNAIFINNGISEDQIQMAIKRPFPCEAHLSFALCQITSYSKHICQLIKTPLNNLLKNTPAVLQTYFQAWQHWAIRTAHRLNEWSFHVFICGYKGRELPWLLHIEEFSGLLSLFLWRIRFYH